MLKRRKGEALNAEQALAARQILGKSANELVNISKRLTAKIANGEASDVDMVAFREAVTRHAAIQEQVSGATAEAGRALAQFRMTADARAVRADVLRSLIDGAGGPEAIKDAAQAIIEGGSDIKRLNATAAALARPKLKDKAIELWYNWLLSGPRTHAVNITSNALTSLGQMPEHATAAAFGVVRKALPGQSATDRVLFSELGARGFGMLQGAKEGFTQAVRTMRTGEPSDLVSKVEAQTQRAISGVKGSILRTPTRALAAEDEFFKAVARRQEIAAQAVRLANKEGLRGKAAKARAAELSATPTPEMLERASDFGRYLTFQRPLGPAGQAVLNVAQKMPLIKLFLPFIRTPTNLFKFAVERSPAAPLLKEWRADVKAGGARRDLALARATLGTGAMMMAVEAAQSGLITGGGPSDDSARRLLEADGWQPYSVKVGNNYYAYQRLDPFSTTLGIAADWVDIQSHMTDKEREQVASLLVSSTLKNLSEKTWFSGMARLGQAVQDPARYGGSLVTSTAGSMAVPAFLAQTAQAVDPYQREAQTIMDRVRSRLPFVSRSLPPRRDVWGSPKRRESALGPGSMSPVFVSPARNDPVNQALLDANAHVGMPQQGALNDAEFARFKAVAGAQSYDAMKSLTASPDWLALAPADRADAVEEALRKVRKQVKRQMFGLPGALAPSGASTVPA
ncbi:MAG: hypothetical protein EOP60_14975, partial [Sphingomonadales bacterium]